MQDIKRDLEQIKGRVWFRKSELERRTKLNIKTDGLKAEIIDRIKQLANIEEALEKIIEDM